MAKTRATPVKRKVSKQKFEEAAKRYTDNTLQSELIIKKSEQRIKKEMEKRHEQLGEMPEQIAEDEATIKQYCEQNREELFGDSKTYESPLGVVVKFKVSPPKLEYGDGVTKEDLMGVLKKKNLLQYIKTTESIDARAIITDRNDDKLQKVLANAGAEITQTENIDVKTA